MNHWILSLSGASGMGQRSRRSTTRLRSCSLAIQALAFSCCTIAGGPFTSTANTSTTTGSSSLVESLQPTINIASRPICHDLLPSRCRVRCYSSTFSTDDDRSAVNNLPRLYVGSSSPSSSTPLTNHAIVPLDANQANYLNVMRITSPKRWGSLAGNLRIFNGSDGEWLAKIIVADGGVGGGNPSAYAAGSSKKKNTRRRDPAGSATTVVVECIEQLRKQPESSSASSSIIQLHMGRLKKPRRKWVLEKATELGVDDIHVVDTEFSSTTDAWEYDKHWLQVVEAAEQCERMTLPFLGETPGTWGSLLDRMEKNEEEEGNVDEQWLVCRERSPESRPLWQTLSSSSRDDRSSASRSTCYHVLVGPEGGWSPTELVTLEDLRQRRPDRVHFVSLGSLVLRAETAAIAAVSAVALARDASSTSTNN